MKTIQFRQVTNVAKKRGHDSSTKSTIPQSNQRNRSSSAVNTEKRVKFHVFQPKIMKFTGTDGATQAQQQQYTAGVTAAIDGIYIFCPELIRSIRNVWYICVCIGTSEGRRRDLKFVDCTRETVEAAAKSEQIIPGFAKFTNRSDCGSSCFVVTTCRYSFSM